MKSVINIARAYLLAFVAVMIVTFGRGYMLTSMDAGDGDSANLLMIFGVLFGLVPAVLLFAAVVAELREEEE